MSDGESEGEDLQEGCHRDYAAVGVLDSYEPDMLDDGAHSALSHSARRRAEEAMSARDMMARARAQAMSSASGRAPKALQQVSANREALVVVATLCGKVKAQNDVQTKACEYLRRAYIGLRCLSGVSQAALPAACIEIASKQCKRPIAREALLRRAGVREQDFIRTLSSLHLLLKIRRQVTVNEACVPTFAS
jgi:transcription initiation factor TFIIIB Brf1 subunit/transcription initiation factor TFIIB